MEDLHKTLQLFYAGLPVDAAANFQHFGVLEQALAAPAQVNQLGIRTPRELFERFTALFGCARWELAEGEDGALSAVTKTCLAAALAPARRLEVEETLWAGESCRFRLE
jgi:hypothetical protein